MRTKAGRKLDLPITTFVRDLLVARRSAGVEEPFVFAGRGRSGHIDEPRGQLRQIAQETGIVVSPHDLRRTYITHAEESDISYAALKGLVNHSVGGSNDVTGSYLQMKTERLREPAQEVCDRLMKLCGIRRRRTSTSPRWRSERGGSSLALSL